MSRLLTSALAAIMSTALIASPVIAKAQTKNFTASADQAFPLLKGFLSLPQSERSAIGVTFYLKLKHGAYKDVSISLADDDKPVQKLTISNDGHITPLPSLTQLKSGAQVTVSGPDGIGPALRLRVVSAQNNTAEFDAAALATAQDQTMKAEKKLAGAMGMFVKIPVLDRAYFSGATSGVVVMKDGSQKPLPTIHEKYAFIPSGTPYFVPSDYPQGVKVKLNTVIAHAFIDEKAH